LIDNNDLIAQALNAKALAEVGSGRGVDLAGKFKDADPCDLLIRLYSGTEAGAAELLVKVRDKIEVHKMSLKKFWVTALRLNRPTAGP
jgi:hypothetical protein